MSIQSFYMTVIAIIKHLFGGGIIEISLPHYPKLVNSINLQMSFQNGFFESISNITWQTGRLTIIINSPSYVYIFEKISSLGKIHKPLAITWHACTSKMCIVLCSTSLLMKKTQYISIVIELWHCYKILADWLARFCTEWIPPDQIYSLISSLTVNMYDGLPK